MRIFLGCRLLIFAKRDEDLFLDHLMLNSSHILIGPGLDRDDRHHILLDGESQFFHFRLEVIDVVPQFMPDIIPVKREL